MMRYDSPDQAIAAMLGRLWTREAEEMPLERASGRVLAEAICADRDSPPCDASAMDGYAVRLEDLDRPSIPLSAPVRIGQAPPPLPRGYAAHIVTGAPVPKEAEAVVRVEDVVAQSDGITLKASCGSIVAGANIRRQGENLPAGRQVLGGGCLLHAGALGALANFGVQSVKVTRKVRIGILTTGDEIVEAGVEPAPWQIRNANAASLVGLFGGASWRLVATPRHARDDADLLAEALNGLLDCCDLIMLTGGVSMGDRDYVPQVIQSCECEVLFHKLPIRPGKPILGAVGAEGQAVLGLPGNPVSVLTTAVRFGSPICRKLAGLPPLPQMQVEVSATGERPIDLWYARPIKLSPGGRGEVIASRGSGDLPSVADSDGFVELPPGGSGEGPWRYFRWEI